MKEICISKHVKKKKVKIYIISIRWKKEKYMLVEIVDKRKKN